MKTAQVRSASLKYAGRTYRRGESITATDADIGTMVAAGIVYDPAIPPSLRPRESRRETRAFEGLGGAHQTGLDLAYRKTLKPPLVACGFEWPARREFVLTFDRRRFISRGRYEMRTATIATRSTAFHEASHAVVAHALCLEIAHVDLVREWDPREGCYRLGRVEYVDPLAGRPGIMATLGGTIGQSIHEGRALTMSRFESGLVERLAREAAGRDWRRLVESSKRKTRDLLYFRWRHVERLARELLRCGELTGEDVHRFLSRGL